MQNPKPVYYVISVGQTEAQDLNLSRPFTCLIFCQPKDGGPVFAHRLWPRATILVSWFEMLGVDLVLLLVSTSGRQPAKIDLI